MTQPPAGAGNGGRPRRRAAVVRPPRLYFSFRSPYSWMAIEWMRRSMPDLFQRVALFPYWDPDPVTRAAVDERGADFRYETMSKAKHLYVLGDTKRLAARLELAMAWPVDIDPWWEVPHLGWIAARRACAAERCYDALIAARWTRGENICDREVFARVIAGAGLDRGWLAATEDGTIRAEGVQSLVSAYEDDVFGVPYGYVGRQRFWGIDRMGLFLDAVAAAPAVPLAPAVGTAPGAGAALAQAPVSLDDLMADPLAGVPAGLPVGSYDRDTAGGCG